MGAIIHKQTFSQADFAAAVVPLFSFFKLLQT